MKNVELVKITGMAGFFLSQQELIQGGILHAERRTSHNQDFNQKSGCINDIALRTQSDSPVDSNAISCTGNISIAVEQI